MIFLIPKPAEDPASTHDKQRDLELLITRSIQLWLAQLLQHAQAEYAEKKDPRDRSLQKGYAWATFRELFPETGPALLHVCLGLYRYTHADCPLSSILYNAAFALHVEEDCTAALNQSGNASAAPIATSEDQKSEERGLAASKSNEDGLVASKSDEDGLVASKSGEDGSADAARAILLRSE